MTFEDMLCDKEVVNMRIRRDLRNRPGEAVVCPATTFPDAHACYDSQPVMPALALEEQSNMNTMTARYALAAITMVGVFSSALAQERVIAITDVTVIPMDRERTLTSQTVVIRGQRIVEVGDARRVRVPNGAHRVDGRGKFLIPGLAEMHGHIPGVNAPPQLVNDILYLYLANGVTTVRGMLGSPNHLTLRAAAAKGEIASPTIIAGAPSLNQNSTPSPEAAITLVTQNVQAGYDFQKVHPGPSRATYDSAVAVARRHNFTLAGHVPAQVGLRRVLEVRQHIDHLDGYLEAAVPEAINARIIHPTETISFSEVIRAIQSERIPELVRATMAARVYNAPTMYLWENFFGEVNYDSLAALPEMRYMPAQQVQNWINQKKNRLQADAQEGLTAADRATLLGFRRTLLKALADGGAPIVMGSDAPQMFNVPGFSIQHEARVMAAAGMTPFQILQSGTTNVARYVSEVLRQDGDFGSIAAGKRADLMLLDRNPLQDIANLRDPAGVMVRGRWYPAEELKRELQAIARRNPRN